MPTLPLIPEPMSDLQARLPEALARVFIAGNDGPDRPGTKRTQVFDTTDGNRLIVSRDYEATSRKTLLHVSVSMESVSPTLTPTRYILRCLQKAAELFEAYQPLTLCHSQMSESGVLHFLFEDLALDLLPTQPSVS